MLLDSGTAGLAPMAEMALMFASRAQHIAEVIEPGSPLEPSSCATALRIRPRLTRAAGGKSGQRASSRVASGAVREFATGPDDLMDSDPQASVSRARRRNKRRFEECQRVAHDENRFEQETHAFFARVHEGYLAIAAREPGRVVVVDARGTPGQTHERIVEIVRGS